MPTIQSTDTIHRDRTGTPPPPEQSSENFSAQKDVMKRPASLVLNLPFYCTFKTRKMVDKSYEALNGTDASNIVKSYIKTEKYGKIFSDLQKFDLYVSAGAALSLPVTAGVAIKLSDRAAPYLEQIRSTIDSVAPITKDFINNHEYIGSALKVASNVAQKIIPIPKNAFSSPEAAFTYLILMQAALSIGFTMGSMIHGGLSKQSMDAHEKLDEKLKTELGEKLKTEIDKIPDSPLKEVKAIKAVELDGLRKKIEKHERELMESLRNLRDMPEGRFFDF